MKKNQEISNPCLKEQNLTQKCFDANGYDKEKCVLQIENYKVCKEFWHHVRTDRRRKGIQPNLPEPDQREKIKLEYLKKGL